MKTKQLSPSDASPLKVQSVRREHGRAILTLTNGEIKVMPRALLRERPYKGGVPFDEESFVLLIKERSYPFAMDKAVALLSMRSRTEKELVDALRKNAYPEQTIARVMQRLQEAGYIDDAQFAEQYCTSRVSRGMGARRIRMDLRMKGVSADTIEASLCAINQSDLLSSAIRVAKKASHGKDLFSRADRQKIIAALSRRGYDYETAKKALQALTEEHSDE